MSIDKLKLNNESGFTLIELLVSTVIFSGILLITTVGIISVTRTYLKGYISTDVQNTDRSIADQITQAVQNSGGNVNLTHTTGSPPYFFCIDQVEYTYNFAAGLNPSSELYRGPVNTNCTNPGLVSASQSLIGANMLLIKPSSGQILSQEPLNPNQYNIQLYIMYANTGTYTYSAPSSYACNSISIGGDFCQEALIETSAVQRTALNP